MTVIFIYYTKSVYENNIPLRVYVLEQMCCLAVWSERKMGNGY